MTIDNSLDKYFDKHIVVSYSDFDIVFKEPESYFGYMRFVLIHNSLMVLGDYESAIYTWPERLTWDFLYNTTFDYFFSKRSAMPSGSQNGYSIVYREEEISRIFKNYGYTISLNKIKELDWNDCSIMENCDSLDIENGDIYEDIYNSARKPCLSCRLHHHGLLLALGKINDNKTKNSFK